MKQLKGRNNLSSKGTKKKTENALICFLQRVSNNIALYRKLTRLKTLIDGDFGIAFFLLSQLI